jgi:hypothetical protein
VQFRFSQTNIINITWLRVKNLHYLLTLRLLFFCFAPDGKLGAGARKVTKEKVIFGQSCLTAIAFAEAMAIENMPSLKLWQLKKAKAARGLRPKKALRCFYCTFYPASAFVHQAIVLYHNLRQKRRHHVLNCISAIIRSEKLKCT